MTFDILDFSDEEIAVLETVQLKLLRTAQQKKDELQHKLEIQLAEYKNMVKANGMDSSSLYDSYETNLWEEFDYQVEILREQLEFNLALREPTNGDETGGTGSDNSAYVVDYELSYMERYIEVRDYYFTIEDPNERVALLAADTVAQVYLGSYYNTLFNYLVTFTK
ncbi:MAG: hypothetical protein K2N14_03255 [Clostridia bacterium]|nr:hypothetical protein [Clostridia bacterium]